MDEQTFGRRMALHRRELVLHCYRMLGAAPDAEDATQEAFLKAWQARATLADDGALRAWLYRIATNVCLALLEKRGPRVLPNRAYAPAAMGTVPRPFLEESHWVGPLPDEQLAPPGATSEAPDVLHARAEHLALAFIAALQQLPARQRAALLLRDVVELSALEAAEVLGSTPAAVEAALQRARATLPARAEEPRETRLEPETRALLERYVAAWHARDPQAFLSLVAHDVSFVMPPTPVWFQGREAVVHFVAARLREHGWQLRASAANGLPAFGLYRALADGGYVAHGLQVLELGEGGVACIHTFLVLGDARLFALCGLPARLDAQP